MPHRFAAKGEGPHEGVGRDLVPRLGETAQAVALLDAVVVSGLNVFVPRRYPAEADRQIAPLLSMLGPSAEEAVLSNKARPNLKSGFTLGGEAAEADHLLEEAFFESSDFRVMESKTDHRCFVVGRTGSGKVGRPETLGGNQFGSRDPHQSRKLVSSLHHEPSGDPLPGFARSEPRYFLEHAVEACPAR